LTRKLLDPNSILITPPTSDPPTVDADGLAISSESAVAQQETARRQWRTDALLDFAAFESNIVRAQFLLNSNERERQRYVEEKTRILETAQAVRENNAQLHSQLAEAQRQLEVKKGYDKLAEKITNNSALKSRSDQRLQIERMNAEIAELERERQEYSETWAERREQFGRIVEEGMQMLRLIRDEKEEAERQEGMDDVEEGEEGESSKTGTPKASAGGATPIHDAHPEVDVIPTAHSAMAVHPLSHTVNATDSSTQAEDAQMADEGEQKANTDVMEEGEATEQEAIVDSMDTT